MRLWVAYRAGIGNLALLLERLELARSSERLFDLERLELERRDVTTAKPRS
jgi:hypothetical protein